MGPRGLFLGILAILAAGAAAWFIARPYDRDIAAERGDPAADFLRPFQREPTSPEAFSGEAPHEPHPHDVLEPGVEAPNFVLETLEGGTFELAEHRGRVVVLNFWATWCEPCRDEMPDLVMTQDALADQGLLVAGISIDEEGREIVEPFHETFPVDYPLLLHGLDVAREYGAQYVVPTTYVVDRTGRIAERFEGAMTVDELLPRLRSHLQQVE